jgi:dTMP kinase
LAARLEAAGRRVEVLREPGGTELGEAIRHLLQHSPKGAGMTDETELLLFAASRAQLVRERVRPLLAAGAVVVLDRFLDSTMVYQGLARGLPLESVRAINAFAVGDTLPAATLLLDMEAETAHGRIAESGRELDRIESQPVAFFQKVRAGYLQVAAESGGRIRVLDAACSPEQIHERVWLIIKDLI